MASEDGVISAPEGSIITEDGSLVAADGTVLAPPGSVVAAEETGHHQQVALILPYMRGFLFRCLILYYMF
jgi:hypothetical protein